MTATVTSERGARQTLRAVAAATPVRHPFTSGAPAARGGNLWCDHNVRSSTGALTGARCAGGGSQLTKRTRPSKPTCRENTPSGERCSKPVHANGLCWWHHRHMRRARKHQSVAAAAAVNGSVDMGQLMRAVVGKNTVTPPPPEASLRTAEELAERLLDLANDEGATESPFVSPTGVVEQASTGCCCALETSDLRSRVDEFDVGDPSARDRAHESLAREIRGWLTAMRPLLETDHVWIGMWRDTDRDVVEMNLTLVLHDRQFAIALGRHQNQIAVYDIDAGDIVMTDGTGGTPYSPETGAKGLHLPTIEQAQLMRSKHQ